MTALLLFAALTSPFFAALIGVYLVRSSNIRRADKQTVYYTLTFPNDMEAEQVTDWHRTLAAAMPPGGLVNRSEYSVVLEWWRDKNGITHVVGVPWTHKDLIGQLIGAIPGLHFAELDAHPAVEWTVAKEFGISDPTRPLDVDRLQAQVTAVLSAGLYEQKPTDQVRAQLVVAPTGKSTVNETTAPVESWTVAMLASFKPSSEDIAERKAKIASPTFKAVLRVAVKADTKAHAEHLLKNVVRSYERADTAHVRLTARFSTSAGVVARLKRGATSVMVPAVLNSNEVTAFSAWPVRGVKLPGLTLGKTRYLPPNENVAQDGLVIGNAAASGYENRRVAIKPVDLFRHAWVLAPSGAGKTSLLGNMMQQSIEQGHGVILFETKGDLFRRALESIPKERVNDAIVIDLTDSSSPVGFNILHEGDAREVIDDLISLFAKNSPDPKYLSQAMYHGLHTLRNVPGTSVIDLVPFLDPTSDDEVAWRAHVIDQLPKNGELYKFWRYMDGLKDSDRRQRVTPVLNRLWKFNSRDDLKRLLGQSKSTFSLSEAIATGKIVLIYAPDQIGGEQVSLLVSLLMGKVWDTIRQTTKEKPTYIYFDEVQRLRDMPIDLAEMLSLMRAYGTGMVMANQYLHQLSPDVLNAMTNVATKFAFRLDGTDARAWQSLIGKEITPDDVMNLDAYRGIARIGLDGGATEPIEIATLEPFDPHGLADEVRAASRRQFTRSAKTVDEEIKRRRTAPSKPVRARPSFGELGGQG